jgi:phage shock protein A
MRFWDRFRTTVRADAHGVIDALEDRALVLKQHLRDAELEVQRKRAALAALERERVRLLKDRERARAERARLDRDVELALAEDKDELARHTLQRLLPLEQLDIRIGDRLDTIADEQRALVPVLAQQESALAELTVRVGAFLSEQAQAASPDAALVPRPVTPEAIELELLRRKRDRDQPERAPQAPPREHGDAPR